MKVTLAGFNVDHEMLRSLKDLREILSCAGKMTENSKESEASIFSMMREWGEVSPESLTSAYARISRDPRDVNALRKKALREIKKARSSNRRIIFDLGHASVSEHAVFNFDVQGISRLAVEELESRRLCSFTEKSQRYIKLERDIVIPEKVKGSALESLFLDTIDRQCRAYETIHSAVLENESVRKERKRKGIAREDARYVLPLAVATQLGMTANARNLNAMIRKFNESERDELKRLAEALYKAVSDAAPSLVPLSLENNVHAIEGRDMERSSYGFFSTNFAGSSTPKTKEEPPGAERGPTKLLSYPEHADEILAQALRRRFCPEAARAVDTDMKKSIFYNVLKKMNPEEGAPREFELVSFLFELTVSASCFAQLKRHRMATIIPGPLDPKLGCVVPSSVKRANQRELFENVMESADSTYQQLKEKVPECADYILTNAHKRKILVNMNARSLYHFAAIRMDRHAQWEIRQTAEEMVNAAKRKAPLAMAAAAGLDNFEENKKRVLNSVFNA